MKTIGVLGGLGPLATIDFEARVHAFAPQVIPPLMNMGYPPMLVYYFRYPPVLMDLQTRRQIPPQQLEPKLLDAAKLLGTHADFLVVVANTPLLFRTELEAAAGKPIMSIIEVTLGEIERRRPPHIGVLEFMLARNYQAPLAAMGLRVTYVPPELQDPMDQAVLRIHEGRNGPESHTAVMNAITYLRDQGTDAILLGCTDLPSIIGPESDAPDCINPSQILAEAAVRYAIA